MVEQFIIEKCISFFDVINDIFLQPVETIQGAVLTGNKILFISY